MKLAFVVTEAGCLDPTTGASQHIAMGMRELGKRTQLVSFLAPVLKTAAPRSRAAGGKPGWRRHLQATGAWGTLRDLRDFTYRARQGWRIAKAVEAAGCEVAYVRAQCLQPISLFLRLRKIKVVLEANGLQYVSRKAQFRSWLSGLYRPFERCVYRTADHVFFVGSYGQYWRLASNNWTEVENGVEPELINRRHEKIGGRHRRLRLVVLSRLVAHHKGHLLPAAINRLEPSVRSRIELHLIGTGFDEIKHELELICRVKDHGFVSRDAIGNLLRRMDCGIIPDCPPYGSQMKLLDYAANGCLVLGPDVFHLKNFFSDKGMVFFTQNNIASLAERISALVSGDLPADELARALQDHVSQTYTWDVIFDRKWQIIPEIVEPHSSAQTEA